MAAPSQSRPGRTLFALFLIIAALLGGVALSARGDGQWTPKLGLDLVGGTSIALEATAEGGEVTPDAMDEAVGIIRNRVDPAGVTEAEISKQGSGGTQSISIAIPGPRDEALLKRVTQTAQLNFRLVLQDGVSGTPPAPTEAPQPSGSASAGASGSPSAAAGQSPTAAASSAPSSAPSTQGRVLPKGLQQAESPSGQPAPSDAPAPSGAPSGQDAPTIDEETPAPAAAGSIEDLLSKVPADVQKKFADLDCLDPNARNEEPDRPDAYLAACASDVNSAAKYLLAPTDLTGDNIDNAEAGLATNSQGQVTSNEWSVQLKFDGAGTRIWRDFTTLHAVSNDRVAVVLDGEVVSDPQINEPIGGGETSITGSFTQTEAQDLANILKYGALPLTFTAGTVQEISPTLGEKQLRGGLLAGVLGLILVTIYCLLWYRGLGLINVISLVVSTVITYLSMVLFSNLNGLRLSLAGVAGLVIGIGIAADSFIVYFERLRDEMREGKSMRVAVEVGWRRARRTIVAADFVSFLAAAVLWVLSVGAVRGFAFTLGLTTIIDILVVFLFTKPVVTLLARTKFFSEGHPLSGLGSTRSSNKSASAPIHRRGRKPGLATRTNEQEA